MTELAKLQDNMPTFPTVDARRMIEKELGHPIDTVFSEFGARPVAAASLAQVYRAKLRSTGEEVAVKVQRPGALATISKVSRQSIQINRGDPLQCSSQESVSTSPGSCVQVAII